MITNSISSLIMTLFGVSSFVFITDFFYSELPTLPNIAPDSLPIAIWSFIGAMITFFLKQSDNIKKMEGHLESLVKSNVELLGKMKEKVELEQEVKKQQKEILEFIAQNARKSSDSQVRRIPQYKDDDLS